MIGYAGLTGTGERQGDGLDLTRGAQIGLMRVLIDRYIARLILWPLMATLAISAMLLLVVRMVELFGLLIDEGGTVTTIFQVLSELVPQYLALGIPVGLLMGVLLTFRKLTLGRELDAMLGSGVSYLRLLRVPMLYALGLSFTTFIVVGFVQPLASYAYEKLRFDVAHGAMGIPVRVGEFTPLGNDLVIRAREAHHSGRELVGVFATSTDDDGRMKVLLAARAELLPATDRDTVVARFMDGTVAQIDPTDGENHVTAFSSYDVTFKLPEFPAFRPRGENERELTLPELISTAWNPNAVGYLIVQSKAGLYRRIAQILVLFFLPFLGVALARPPLRSTNSSGLFAALALFIVYNELSLFAERLGFAAAAPLFTFQGGLLLGFGALSLALFVLSITGAGDSIGGSLLRLLRGSIEDLRRETEIEAPEAATQV